MELLLFGALLLQACSTVLSYAEGAPTSTCVDMKPEHHGVNPQTSMTPYTIITSTSTFESGKRLTVTISGSNYTGFLLQARSGSNPNPLGTWEMPPPNTKYLRCSGNSQGAITHANINMKNNLTTFTWMPPNTTNSIFFIATVAKEKETYWLNVKSNTLTRVGTMGNGSTSNLMMGATPVVLFLALLVSTVFQS